MKITIELDRRNGLWIGIGLFIVGCTALLVSLFSAVMMSFIISLIILSAAVILISVGLFVIVKSLE